jgi:hypothetical protein
MIEMSRAPWPCGRYRVSVKESVFFEGGFESDGYRKKGEWDGGAAEDQEWV